MDPLVVLGGVEGAANVQREDPTLAWSARLAAHEVIMGDVRRQRERSS